LLHEVAFFRDISLDPALPGDSGQKDVRYLDIHAVGEMVDSADTAGTTARDMLRLKRWLLADELALVQRSMPFPNGLACRVVHFHDHPPLSFGGRDHGL
jgi:hypothetical protein